MFCCFAIFHLAVQGIPKHWTTVSYGTVREHFLIIVYRVVLGVSCLIIMFLAMFDKIR